MRRSSDRFLSSHGGNLPRPPALDALLVNADAHRARIDAEMPRAVRWVVDAQIECGIDIVNDGEFVKAANLGNYINYAYPRVAGFGYRERPEGTPPKRGGAGERDRRDFPGVYESGLWFAGSGGPIRPGFLNAGQIPQSGRREPVCQEPLRYVGQAEIRKDIHALKAALGGRQDVDGFIAALGPLSLAAGSTNLYYRDERDYLMAAAEVMREEYKAITDAGLVLQIDEPEFATGWMFYPDWSIEEYRDYLRFCVEVINHAVEGLPEEQIRFHMCWGSGHRPHTNDIELKHIVDLLFGVKAEAYSFEASNVRHAHEYRVFEEVKLPEGKIIMPGVIGHYTDLVEHPELVAERLVNFARLVGMENVHAGTDCGIGSRVGHEEVVWAKLKAMTEGCRIAARRMKGK